MAVEIRELIIKATLEDAKQNPAATEPQADPSSTPDPMQTEKVVEAAVEQVLKILKRNQYR